MSHQEEVKEDSKGLCHGNHSKFSLIMSNFTEQNNSSDAAHCVAMIKANIREWKKVEVKCISLT
jgi:hypothetical protein